MADTGRPDDDAPGLEMPSFSLRRKKKAPPEDAEPEPEPVAEPRVEVPARPAYEPPTADVPVVEEDDEPAHLEPSPRRELPLSGLPAAAVTGVVVGGLAVLLAWLAGRGCETVRGTSSCGGGPGFLILLVVLAVLALAGAWLLARFGVPDAGSTSLLAVGIMAVLVMVFLLGSLDQWWSAIAVPVTAAVGYGVSWWVTNVVAGDDARQDVAESHDVR